MDRNPLADLTGTELGAVCIVQEYVQFYFHGPVLRAFTDPSGDYDGTSWQFPTSGPADMLRRYVGLTVARTEIIEGDHIALEFDGGHRILISLRPEDRTGPEAAQYIGADDGGELDPTDIAVW